MTLHQLDIKILLLLLLPAIQTSCADEEIFTPGAPADTSASISYNVTSGQDIEKGSRSGEDDGSVSGLEPQMMSLGDSTLYLHRYVGSESERATGGEHASRGLQVNDMATFKAIAGGFGVSAELAANPGAEYFPWTKASTTLNNSDNLWQTVTPNYWPHKGEELRFHAFAPHTAINSLQGLTAAAGKISFGYTVPTSPSAQAGNDAKHQPDLMFASGVASKTTFADSRAHLNFRHALSAIKFRVRDITDGEIVSVAIRGVNGKGNCVYNSANGSFMWSGLSSPACYTQKFNVKTEDKYPNPNPEKEITGTMPEATFMLIPQALPENAVLEVVFKYSYGHGTLPAGSTKTLTAPLRTTDIPSWDAGKEYVYTISTSNSVWTYYFIVTGSEQTENDANPEQGAWKDNANNIIINPTVTENGYYKVTSYRERANAAKTKETVPWTAVLSDGRNIAPDNTVIESKYTDQLRDLMTLPSDSYLRKRTLEGNGSTNATKYEVEFAPQQIVSNYQGDWDMKNRTEVGTANNPIDLSMRNHHTYSNRNTANCYVVDRGGYFMFPLVYGNAVSNGSPNERSYIYSGTATKSYDVALKVFKDHRDENITSPYIYNKYTPTSAKLLWQDAYNLVEDVKLSHDKTAIEFHVNQRTIQQGNAVIAVYGDGGKILWSWHIWVSDHMLKPDGSLKLGNGDINCASYSGSNRYVQTRNLGWCDPKRLQYMKRTGTLTFSQTGTGKTKTLDLLQREKYYDYWEGNNTYYQFGRKDPSVGFYNAKDLKLNFGPDKYDISTPQPVTLGKGILQPNSLFVGGTHNDWVRDASGKGYYNLWDNTSTQTDYTGTKTVYDPSPAGYKVPHRGFFFLFTKNNTGDQDFKPTNNTAAANRKALSDFQAAFNGVMTDTLRVIGNYEYRRYNGYSKKPGTTSGRQEVMFNATGMRWYTDNAAGKPGELFNAHLVYMHTNMVIDAVGSSNVFVVGKDYNVDNKTTSYVLYTRFKGRRVLARPVRAIRE